MRRCSCSPPGFKQTAGLDSGAVDRLTRAYVVAQAFANKRSGTGLSAKVSVPYTLTEPEPCFREWLTLDDVASLLFYPDGSEDEAKARLTYAVLSEVFPRLDASSVQFLETMPQFVSLQSFYH